jgi:hypothetical protein
MRVIGFGKHKTDHYGPQLLEALGRFQQGERREHDAGTTEKPADERIRLLRERRSPGKVALVEVDGSAPQ